MTASDSEFFGSGTASFGLEGNIISQASAGVNPGATGADNVLAVFQLPANSLDQAGRGIAISASGGYAGNTNTKTVKIIVGPASAVVGSTVGTGGTTIASTGAVATNGADGLLRPKSSNTVPRARTRSREFTVPLSPAPQLQR
jgi:hypothetical protein